MSYKITSGTKEWATYNVNCLDGCYNDCRYCYAKLMAIRFGRHTVNTWRKVRINYNAIQRNYPLRKGRIMFPSSHDIFDPPRIKEACFTVLNKLLRAGNNVLITTKPRLSIIRDIIHQFRKYTTQIQFRFTITSANNSLLSFWEPNAPTFEERLASLKYAHLNGFKTSVSIEPFLDYDPTDMVLKIMPYITESVWIGKMNYILKNSIKSKYLCYYIDIRKNYTTEHLFFLYSKMKNLPKIRFKDSIMIKLGIQFRTNKGKTIL